MKERMDLKFCFGDKEERQSGGALLGGVTNVWHHLYNTSCPLSKNAGMQIIKLSFNLTDL